MEKYDIICITSSFPHGSKETYFENELKYLAKAYKNVYILPIYNPYSSIIRDTPENVILLDPILKRKKSLRIIQLLKTGSIFNSLTKEFYKERVFLNFFKLLRWFNSLILYSVGAERLISLFRENIISNSITIYSYWAECPFFIHDKLESIFKVVRMHGADFYTERNRGYLPARQEIYDKADLLLPISKDIYTRLQNFYDQSVEKMYLSYLGVENIERTSAIRPFKNNEIRIVSCSNAVALKRIHLIYDILMEIDEKYIVEWHHIGDGDELDCIRRYTDIHRKKNISCVFHGQRSQQEIKTLYSNTFFHWFINTSQYEGLPVSIMEAFSFGIPAIATNVGGTKEIVDENNGSLIERNIADTAKVASMIIKCFDEQYFKKRSYAFQTWKRQFNAELNYKKMIAEFYDRIDV